MIYNDKPMFCLLVGLLVSWGLAAPGQAWQDPGSAVSQTWLCSVHLILGGVAPWGTVFSWQITGVQELGQTTQ